MMNEITKEDFEYIEGSGNVYRDFGEQDAIVKQTKADLAAAIIKTLRIQKLTTVQAAKITGFNRTEFSRLKEPELKTFTIDRLMKILNALDPQIEMKLKLKRGSKRADFKKVNSN